MSHIRFDRRMASFFTVSTVSILLACFAFLSSHTPDAQALTTTPTTMNFQGRLADSTGTIMPDGLYNMKFNLYTASTGGTAVWSETRENNGTDYRVQVTNGLFSTKLGQATPLSASLFASGALYFEITMATPGTATCATTGCATWESPMSPRHQLATSAYAYNAETLDGLDSTAFGQLAANNTWTGTNAVNATSGSAFMVQNATGTQTVLSVDTSAGRVGINTTPSSYNLEVAGTAQVAGDSTGQFVVRNGGQQPVFIIDTTNNKLNLQAAANATSFNPIYNAQSLNFTGKYWNGSSTTSRTFTVAQLLSTSGIDSRLAFVNNVGTEVGTIYDDGTAKFINTLMAPVIDAASFGTLTVGAANATSISLAKNTTIASGKVLTIAGDTSTNINGYSSPAAGAITYDTTNKQLLVYANGKWQADRSDAVLVAASNSSQADKNAADYVANGDTATAADGDQVQINQALTAASGKKVVLLAGTYTVDAAISVPNNTTLTGVGAGTKLTIPNSFNAAIKVITNTDTATGTGVTISNMSLDGNSTNNSSGLENGIFLDGLGDSTTNRQGGTVQNIQVSNFLNVGISLQNSDGNTITNNRAKNNYYNIDVESSYQNTITANTTASGTWGVYIYGGGENTVSGNTAEKSTNGNIRIDTTKGTSVTGNIAKSGNYAGISVYNSTDVTVTGNTVEDNIGAGIEVGWTNTSIIASNRILNSGNTTNNKGIYVYSSDSNQFTNNKITDTSCTTTCYAIDITDSASDKNNISGNTFVGDGTYTASLHDLGTGTILSSQAASENGQDVRYKQAASTTALSVQNASGVGVLTVDTTNGLLQVGNYNGGVNAVNGKIAFANSTNANTVSIQSGATSSSYSITLPSSLGASGNCLVDTTGTGVLGFSSCGGGGAVSSVNTQTGAITIQGTTNQIAVNTTGGTLTLSTPQDINTTSGVTFGSLVVGSGGNTITLNGSGYVATGTYRHSKTVTLMAEYANTVLDNGGTGNNTGTMTTALDLTNRMNYYKWTTTSGTNQTYDVVIQVPIPSDFDGWGSNPLSISTYTNNTTNGTITLEARDTAGSVQCNFVSVTPGSTSTWAANNTACTLAAGTYTAGGYMTLRVRMQSGNAGDTRIGNIVLNYKSKF